jgi:hypothetical protein
MEKEKDCLCSWIKTYCTRILIVSPLVYIAPYILLFPSHTTVDIEAEKKHLKYEQNIRQPYNEKKYLRHHRRLGSKTLLFSYLCPVDRLGISEVH